MMKITNTETFLDTRHCVPYIKRSLGICNKFMDKETEALQWYGGDLIHSYLEVVMNRYRTRIQVFWLSARFACCAGHFVACRSGGRMCRAVGRNGNFPVFCPHGSQRLAESEEHGIWDPHCIYRRAHLVQRGERVHVQGHTSSWVVSSSPSICKLALYR